MGTRKPHEKDLHMGSLTELSCAPWGVTVLPLRMYLLNVWQGI
jgi:hypothetical protein